MPDIDIDFVDRDQALTLFEHIPASRLDNNRLVKHNTGVYLHAVPVDAVSGLCQIPYEQAEEQKYFKIDFLNAWRYNPEDPTDFRGTIICRPCYDPPSQTLSDWERLDYDYDRSLDETE